MSNTIFVDSFGFYGFVESLKLVGVVIGLNSTGDTCQASIGALSSVNLVNLLMSRSKHCRQHCKQHKFADVKHVNRKKLRHLVIQERCIMFSKSN